MAPLRSRILARSDDHYPRPVIEQKIAAMETFQEESRAPL